MKNYSVRVQIKLEANSDEDAKRKMDLYLKELPRLENLHVRGLSIFNTEQKKTVLDTVGTNK